MGNETEVPQAAAPPARLPEFGLNIAYSFWLGFLPSL